MSRKSIFGNENFLFATMFVEIVLFIGLLLLSFYLMRMKHLTHEELSRATELRSESYVLADRLRHSSDDLTRMVRTYVSTGDPRFEEYFWTILRIRNGEVPRPKHYDRVYWDFVTAGDGTPPNEDGPKIPMEDLMLQAGFTADELALLEESKRESDALVSLETQAMKAMKGVFLDSDMEVVREGDPDPELARSLVFGEEYHQAKKRIMEPLNEFFKRIDDRTAGNLERASAAAEWHRNALDVTFCTLVVIGVILLLTVRRHHGLLVRRLRSSIKRQGRELVERERAEAALRKSEARLKDAEKISHLGSWELDLENEQLAWSDEVYKIFELDPATTTPSYELFVEAVHPDDRWMVEEAYQRSVRERSGYSVKHRIRTPDGRVKHVVEQGKTYYSYEGTPSRTVGTVQDVTSLATTELALEDSEARYRSMMEHMDDAAFICSADYAVEYMNPAMVRRVGAVALGEPCYRVIHGESDVCAWCDHGKIMARQPSRMEVMSPLDDRSYLLSSSPVPHGDGTVSKLTVLRDVTEIKKLEGRLRQAEKMEAIGTLAAGIAHDFNNILFPIVGASEMLMEDLPPGSQELRSAEEIFKAGRRGSDLVKQILSLSRHSEQRVMPVKIGSVVKEAVKLCRSTIPATVEIFLDTHGEVGLVNGDPTQIHQVIMNLVTNAYQAMDSSEGKISVVIEEMRVDGDDAVFDFLEPGGYARLMVSDNGQGIAAALMDKIFEPYFTTKEQGKGTGLGLATVYRIVKEHGGEIRVYSEVGEGTVFHIYLPVLDQVHERDSGADAEADARGDERILLVDDDESVAGLESEMLSRLGYRVTVYTRPIAALEAFQADPERFDLVVSDMTMPGMTGLELSRRLLACRPGLPVVMCTGFSDPVNTARAMEIGVRRIMTKPAVRAEMARAVRDALDTTPE